MCLGLPILSNAATTKPQKKQFTSENLTTPEQVTKELLKKVGFNGSSLTWWEENKPIVLDAAKNGFLEYQKLEQFPNYASYEKLLDKFRFTRKGLNAFFGYAGNGSTIYQLFERDPACAFMVVAGAFRLINQEVENESSI